MKFKLILIVLVIFPILCFGYDFENGGVRNAALGETGIASSKDVSIAVWNPSGLAAFNYFHLITDSRPYMIQMDNDNIAQNFVYLAFPIIKLPGAFAVTGGSFNSNDYMEGRFGLHYGVSISPEKLYNNFSLGLSLFDHYTNFIEISEGRNAIDLDMGFSYRLNQYANFGLIAGNILQANMAIGNDSEDKLPLRFGLGSEFTWKRINLSGDFLINRYNKNNDLVFGVGLEYILARNLQLRFGLNNNDITGGFGIQFYSRKWIESAPVKNERLDYSFLQICLDYAFQYPFGETRENNNFYVGNDLESDYGEHFFGIRIDFGKSKDTEENLAFLFPSQFGVNLKVRVDTVYTEKVVIDTVFETRTIHDTLIIYERLVDEMGDEGKINETRITKSDIEKINQATVHLIAALEFYYSENYYQAIDECNRAIDLAPDLSLSYIRLASIYYRLGDIEEALYQLRFAQNMDPNNSEIRKMLQLLSKE